jgi:serine/threonine-protein kinase HipA
MHTLSGLLHADYRIPNLDYSDFLKVTRVLTNNYQEVLQAYRRMVFNVLTHNRDDHSKNFAFLLTNEGWHLSPAYDLTFSSGVAGEHTMTIAGEGANPNKDHLLTIAKKAAVENKQALSIIDEVRSVIGNWMHYAKQAEVTSSSAKSLDRILKNIAV